MTAENVLSRLKALPALIEDNPWRLFHMHAQQELARIFNDTEGDADLRCAAIDTGVEMMPLMVPHNAWSARLMFQEMLEAAKGRPQLAQDVIRAGLKAIPGFLKHYAGLVGDVYRLVIEDTLGKDTPRTMPVLTRHFARTSYLPDRELNTWFTATQQRGVFIVSECGNGNIADFRRAVEKEYPKAEHPTRKHYERVLKHAETFSRMASGELTPEGAAQEIERLDGAKYAVLTL